MNPQLPSITACLLAGGKSSRMGRDKAGVEFFGKPLWQHQVETLQRLDPQELLISGRTDARYGDSNFPVIVDELEHAGPLSGIAALLGAATNPLVLVLAVDMPYMTSEYLAQLRNCSSLNFGIVPEQDGFFEGVAAIFPKSARELALEVLRGEDHSLQHFVRRCVEAGLVKVTPVRLEDGLLFRSLNTPGDVP